MSRTTGPGRSSAAGFGCVAAGAAETGGLIGARGAAIATYNDDK